MQFDIPEFYSPMNKMNVHKIYIGLSGVYTYFDVLPTQLIKDGSLLFTLNNELFTAHRVKI